MARPASAGIGAAGRVHHDCFIALAAAAAALVTFGNYARRVDMPGTVLPTTGRLWPTPDARRLLTNVSAGHFIIRSGLGFKQCSLDHAGRGSRRGRLVDFSSPSLLTWAGCFLPFGLSASGKPVAPGTSTEWLLSLNE